MRTVRRIAELRESLAGHRAQGASIGLVPTMGGFHDGHLALISRARSQCDVVVVSLFVNPTQFDDPRDLEAYPRDEERDAELAARYGVDFLFAPAPRELYPDGFSTTVSVRGLTEPLEGAHRGRGHFEGVATVVSKLLNIVSPDAAFFGQKDAQQALVINRLVADLNFPVRVEVCPTVREADGLAMSSRNVRLGPEERPRAAALYRALRGVQEAIENGAQDPAAARIRALGDLSASGVAVEYLELVSPDTLEPVASVDGEVLAVVAARVGNTRLIDNLMIRSSVVAAGAATSDQQRKCTKNPPQPVPAGAAEHGSS
jgi:pantoate--beta-alanine ligase